MICKVTTVGLKRGRIGSRYVTGVSCERLTVLRIDAYKGYMRLSAQRRQYVLGRVGVMKCQGSRAVAGNHIGQCGQVLAHRLSERAHIIGCERETHQQ